MPSEECISVQRTSCTGRKKKELSKPEEVKETKPAQQVTHPQTPAEPPQKTNSFTSKSFASKVPTLNFSNLQKGISGSNEDNTGVKKEETAAPVKENLTLTQAWDALKQDCKARNKRLVHLALEKVAVTDSMTRISISTSGQHQFDVLIEERSDLLQFLKAKTGISAIDLDIQLEEQQKNEARPYTNKEILQEMIRLNPSMLDGLKDLGLDPD